MKSLNELMTEYPVGTKIHIKSKERDDYGEGDFIVDGYLYEYKTDAWYCVHCLWDGKYEKFNQ